MIILPLILTRIDCSFSLIPSILLIFKMIAYNWLINSLWRKVRVSKTTGITRTRLTAWWNTWTNRSIYLRRSKQAGKMNDKCCNVRLLSYNLSCQVSELLIMSWWRRWSIVEHPVSRRRLSSIKLILVRTILLSWCLRLTGHAKRISEVIWIRSEH
jgi:hypothetical protein